MQELNRRNTETVEAAMKDMYSKIYDQQIHINNIQTALSNMTEKLNTLELQLTIQKVRLTGLGPSVRE